MAESDGRNLHVVKEIGEGSAKGEKAGEKETQENEEPCCYSKV